ncbi:MAG: hypothetical protein ABF289_19895 [Clostridiales bacterium]
MNRDYGNKFIYIAGLFLILFAFLKQFDIPLINENAYIGFSGSAIFISIATLDHKILKKKCLKSEIYILPMIIGVIIFFTFLLVDVSAYIEQSILNDLSEICTIISIAMVLILSSKNHNKELDSIVQHIISDIEHAIVNSNFELFKQGITVTLFLVIRDEDNCFKNVESIASMGHTVKRKKFSKLSKLYKKGFKDYERSIFGETILKSDEDSIHVFDINELEGNLSEGVRKNLETFIKQNINYTIIVPYHKKIEYSKSNYNKKVVLILAIDSFKDCATNIDLKQYFDGLKRFINDDISKIYKEEIQYVHEIYNGK